MSMQKVDGNSARALFGSTEALMVKSCLENVMGNIYAPSDPPESAAAILGNFCYFGGKADRETVAYRPNSYKDGFIIMIPPDEEWVRTIVEVYGDRAVKMTRYAFKAPEKWDREKLTAFAAALPEGYEMQPIDRALFDVSAASEWAGDFVSNYSGYDDYARNGMGVAVLKGGELIGGVSAYAYCSDGIEIEIDTVEGHRRKGIAAACAAKLILDCDRLGIYPEWDAQNKWSAALAVKLGYEYAGEYTVYEITDY